MMRLLVVAVALGHLTLWAQCSQCKPQKDEVSAVGLMQKSFPAKLPQKSVPSLAEVADSNHPFVPVCKETGPKLSLLQTNDLPQGSWELKTCGKAYFLDFPFLSGLKSLVRGSRVVELGAGCGCYTRGLIDAGVKVAAYDGVPNIAKLTDGLVQTFDLTQDITPHLDEHEWTICTEVGEHVPSEFEDILLKNIVTHTTHGVVLSWAVPGQGGRGHVNTRENEYIIDKMAKLGFAFDPTTTESLRSNTSLPWFKHTLLVFMKNDAEATSD